MCPLASRFVVSRDAGLFLSREFLDMLRGSNWAKKPLRNNNKDEETGKTIKPD